MTRQLLERRQLVPALEAGLAVYDLITAQHSHRVAVMAVKLGEALGLSDRERLHLAWGAALHDIGKMAVPASVLTKNGSLNAHEWDIIKTHSNVGAELLLAIHADLAPVASAVRAHHERWDGTGYPVGLVGDEVPLAGRIVSVVDAFDTMRAGRPYRRVKSTPEALTELSEQAGTQFDPELVALFIDLHEQGRFSFDR